MRKINRPPKRGRKERLVYRRPGITIDTGWKGPLLLTGAGVEVRARAAWRPSLENCLPSMWQKSYLNWTDSSYGGRPFLLCFDSDTTTRRWPCTHMILYVVMRKRQGKRATLYTRHYLRDDCRKIFVAGGTDAIVYNGRNWRKMDYSRPVLSHI